MGTRIFRISVGGTVSHLLRCASCGAGFHLRSGGTGRVFLGGKTGPNRHPYDFRADKVYLRDDVHIVRSELFKSVYHDERRIRHEYSRPRTV